MDLGHFSQYHLGLPMKVLGFCSNFQGPSWASLGDIGWNDPFAKVAIRQL